MQLCSIVPVNHSEWMYNNKNQSISMQLTHLVEKYPKYAARALKEINTYKILDNSLIEIGEALTMERLIKAADMIKADEIILCDKFLDCDGTIESTKEAIKWLKENNRLGDFKLMAVAHGKNKEEWEKCFNYLDNMPEIDVIGIPKVCASWLPSKNRGELADIFMKSKKTLHFLGSWYNLQELLDLPKEVFQRVRSCDTCLPSLYVIQNKHVWEDRDGTIDLEKNYTELTKRKYNKVLKEFNDLVFEKYYKHKGE